MRNVLLLTILGLFLWMTPQGVSAQTNPANLNWAPPINAESQGLRADPELFLQGNFAEVGVGQSGSFGTFGAPPPGYHSFAPHPDNGFGLGFVADPGKDGWAVSVPPMAAQSGDYFVPGTPEERWVVEWNVGATESNFQMGDLMYEVDIPQTSLTLTSAGTTNSCVWMGTATGGPGESLDINMEVTFEDDDAFFVMNVTMTNSGSVTLESLEYMRNVDPDQGVDVCGGIYETHNYVKHQPGAPGSGDTALVIAYTNGCGEIPLGLFAIDPHAVVSTEGFSNRNPDDILDSPVAPPEAAPNYADQAIALAFRWPSIAPGESIQFQYAYILNDADLGDPGNVLPPSVPLSDYAVFLALGLMIIFAATIIRFRRMA